MRHDSLFRLRLTGKLLNATPMLAVALLLGVSMGGCNAVDPYNIIGRRAPDHEMPNTPVPIIDANWKQTALDIVWTTINERYYDPKLNGVDWRAVRDRYAPQLRATQSDAQFWELLDKMTGELKDSHTRVHSPQLVAQQRASESHSLGIGFIALDGALVLTSVHPDSDAYWAGARAGMTIKTIDGAPALPLYERLVSLARDTSTPWARTRGALRKISSGDIGTPVSMSFVRTDGHEIDANMKRRKFRNPTEFTHRLLPSGFAYIRFSNFVGSLQSELLSAIDSMKASPGLILDLRNNGGGSLAMAQRLVSKFLSTPTPGGKTLTRTGKPISLFFIDTIKLTTELKGNKADAYTKPLVILTNEGSASASEVTAATLQDLARATVIGQRSCGCLLGYLGMADLPGGAQMAYSEIGFVTPNGKRIEGEGVIPDRVIALTRDDYVQNRDRILEAAEAFLMTNQQLTVKAEK